MSLRELRHYIILHKNISILTVLFVVRCPLILLYDYRVESSVQLHPLHWPNLWQICAGGFIILWPVRCMILSIRWWLQTAQSTFDPHFVLHWFVVSVLQVLQCQGSFSSYNMMTRMMCQMWRSSDNLGNNLCMWHASRLRTTPPPYINPNMELIPMQGKPLCRVAVSICSALVCM